MFLSQSELLRLVRTGTVADPAALVITPFAPQQANSRTVGRPVVSFGPDADGYDVRVSRRAQVLRVLIDAYQPPLDPATALAPEDLIDLPIEAHATGFDYFTLSPGAYVYVTVEERVQIPPHIGGIVTAKRALASCGLISPPLKIRPGWHGQLIIQLFVASPRPVMLRIGEGIATFAFYYTSDVPRDAGEGHAHEQPLDDAIDSVA